MRDEQTCLQPRVGSASFFRLSRGGRIARSILAFCALAASNAGAASAAAADFVLTSPSSPAYYAYGALAGRTVQLKGTVEVTGNVHSNDRVHLQNGSRVTGNVSASGTVQNQGTVTGTVRSGAPQVALPALQSDAELRALADRVRTGSVTLNNATVDDVLFVVGDVEIRGTLRGTGTIIATGQIELKEVSSSTLPPAGERISLIAKKDVHFQKGRAFRGAIYAAGDVDIQKDSTLAGVVVAGRDLTVDKNTRITFVRQDPAAPTIRLIAPIAGSTVAEARPRIEVEIKDDLSGAAPATLRFRLDGFDRTAEILRTASGFTFDPASPLADGAHGLAVDVSDAAGNAATATFSFSVRTVRLLAIQAPLGTVAGNLKPLAIVALDPSAGTYDPASLRVAIDGAALSDCRSGLERFLCQAPVLSLGGHAIHAEVRTTAGALLSDDGTFTIVAGSSAPDTTAPTLSILTPTATTYVDPTALAPIPDAQLAFADGGSGIDLGTLSVLLDGRLDLTVLCDLAAGSARCRLPLLGEGTHSVAAEIRDLAGNPATASVEFAVDEPGEPDVAGPALTVSTPAPGAYFKGDMVQVEGTVSDDRGVSGVLINGGSATVVDGRWSGLAMLMGEGPNPINVDAFDTSNNRTHVEFDVTLDRTAPTVSIASPVPGFATNDATVVVTGTAHDDVKLAAVTVDGVAAALDEEGGFRAEVPVESGLRPLTAVAADAAGNTAAAAVELRRYAPPKITLAAAGGMALTREATIRVVGTVDPPNSAVTLRGVAVPVAAGAFAADVPLVEGLNYVDAQSPGADGTIGVATLVAVRDSRPPLVTVDVPAAGAVLFEPAVAVSGALSDLSSAIRSPGPIAVTVAGIAAEVEGGRYLARGVPLAPGENVIEIVAADALGNSARREVTVTYQAVAGEAHIEKRAGDGQSATVGAALPLPLEAATLDASGAPVGGVAVVFRVVGGDGSLRAGAGGAAGRAVVATSGPDGIASASWTVGRSAAAGRNRVEAAATGFAGRAVFTADARPGPAANVFVDIGNNQMGAVGRPLERPISVVITDAANNRLVGAVVRFEATEGGGGFGGGPSLDLSTDADGRAEAVWTLGYVAGTDAQRARAYLPGLGGGASASFVASGLISGDPAATRIEGLVVDNADLPVPGATVEIHHLEQYRTTTGPDGRFSLGPVPPGHRALLVDGATSSRPGVWPHLIFDFSVVPGAVHDMGRPMYLVDLDPQHGIDVSETEGGTITIPEVPGFALAVEPGAATFPDGSRAGRLSISVVHGDKVPMVPSGGQQPQFIVTFQPPGVRLDPPARLTLPNVDGLAPGETIELYSFDHDQGQFLIVGHATVSEDALTMTSDPGVGIPETGWHGGSNPSPDGDACGSCGPCETCMGDRCVPKPDGSSCDDNKFCTDEDMCSSGVCTGRKKPEREDSQFDFQIGEFINKVTSVTSEVSAAASCKIKGPFVSGGIRIKKVQRCCESEDAYKPEERLTGTVKILLDQEECVFPGGGITFGSLFKAGIYFKTAVEVTLEGGGADFQCAMSGCERFVAGTGKAEVSGGLIVQVLGPDLLKVVGGVRGAGQLSIKDRCGETSFTGMFGPIQAYWEATLLSLVKFTDVHNFDSTKKFF